MNFSKAVRIARTKVGIHQKVLAKRCGITPEYLSKIETGKKNPTIQLIERIANELKVPAYGIVLLAMEQEDVKPEKQKLFKNLKPLLEKLIHVLFLEEMLDDTITEMPFKDLNLKEILSENSMEGIKGGSKPYALISA